MTDKIILKKGSHKDRGDGLCLHKPVIDALLSVFHAAIEIKS